MYVVPFTRNDSKGNNLFEQCMFNQFTWHIENELYIIIYHYKISYLYDM